MPLRALAIDDEPLALRVLTAHAQHLPQLQLTTTTDPVAGLRQAQQGEYDLIFLDIQMAALTGFQFLKLLGDRCAVVLTTAYAQYALQGYEYAVADYLLKPVSLERLLAAVQRVEARLAPAVEPAPALPAAPPPPYLFVKTEHRLVRINHADICYVEGGKDYATIVTAAGRVLTLTTLTQLTQQLPPQQFVRVHKSYTVALARIEAVEKQRIYLGSHVIPVGEAYRAEFMRQLGASPG